MDNFKCSGVMLLDLTRTSCRWPVRGDGAGTVFCGKQHLLGAYCSTHALKSIGRGTEGERRALRGLLKAVSV